MKTGTKRVVLYPRVSTKLQAEDGWSVSAQIAAMRQYCDTHGLVVRREINDDIGKSATSLSGRDGMQQLLAESMLQPRPFDAVLIWSIDRSFRNSLEGLTAFKQFEEAGVELISLNEHFDNTASGHMLKAITLAVAEHESRRKSERTRLGQAEAAKQGSWLFRPPIGYVVTRLEIEGKHKFKLELDAVYAPIVQEIFEQVFNGKGIARIAEDLNIRGLKTPRGNNWTTDTVWKILHNPVYCGDIVHGQRPRIFGSKKRRKAEQPIITHDAHPAIIDRDTFIKAKEIIASRQRSSIHPRSVGSRFLLSGYAYCQCGSLLSGRSSISRRYSYYFCQGRSRRKTDCQQKGLRADKLEAVVVNKLAEVILEPDTLLELIKLANDAIAKADSDVPKRIASTQLELKKIGEKIERLVDAIADGDGDVSDIKSRISALKKRSRGLEQELYTLADQQAERPEPICESDIRHYVNNLRQVLAMSDIEQRKSCLRGLIESVSLWLPKITIEFKHPATLTKSNQKSVSPLNYPGFPV